MNAINPNTIVILTTLSALSSFAQSSELILATTMADYPDAGAQTPPISTQRRLAADNPANAAGLVGQVSISREEDKNLWDATSVRTNALAMSFTRTGVAMSDDRASFSIYAPMQSVNGMLSFAGYASQSRLNDSHVALAQLASFAVKRQVNVEFAYSVQTNNYGKFDSSIIYRLNPNFGSSKSDVVIGVRYRLKF